MVPASVRRVVHTRRLIGTALLLAVFLLPFHFHSVNPLPLINKNCTCYSEARTQLGLLHADTSLAPVIQAFPVIVLETFFLVPLFTKPHASRAPPAL